MNLVKQGVSLRDQLTCTIYGSSSSSLILYDTDVLHNQDYVLAFYVNRNNGHLIENMDLVWDNSNMVTEILYIVR